LSRSQGRTFYETIQFIYNRLMPSAVSPSLAWAHPLVQEWFTARFSTPTEPQEQGWPHILAGHTTLISAPTGSGKTLAAFLACINRLVCKALAGELHDRTEVLIRVPAQGARQRHSEKS
jgi:ATP-dependent Lhr-like helicase